MFITLCRKHINTNNRVWLTSVSLERSPAVSICPVHAVLFLLIIDPADLLSSNAVAYKRLANKQQETHLQNKTNYKNTFEKILF